MKTLIIVAHPDVENSQTQQFLLASTSTLTDVTKHLLDEDDFDIKKEQQLLTSHDRIIFQFPMYWYSAPSCLKRWIDNVFDYQFATNQLKQKELGIVVSLGVSEEAFASGKSEKFSLSELFKPFEALANKCGMEYMPIFPISLFSYMTEKERKKLLISYQYYLTSNNSSSFKDKEQWFIERLEAFIEKDRDDDLFKLLELMTDNRDVLDEIELLLSEMR